jgi:hypothetical protein
MNKNKKINKRNKRQALEVPVAEWVDAAVHKALFDGTVEFIGRADDGSSMLARLRLKDNSKVKHIYSPSQVEEATAPLEYQVTNFKLLRRLAANVSRGFLDVKDEKSGVIEHFDASFLRVAEHGESVDIIIEPTVKLTPEIVAASGERFGQFETEESKKDIFSTRWFEDNKDRLLALTLTTTTSQRVLGAEFFVSDATYNATKNCLVVKGSLAKALETRPMRGGFLLISGEDSNGNMREMARTLKSVRYQSNGQREYVLDNLPANANFPKAFGKELGSGKYRNIYISSLTALGNGPAGSAWIANLENGPAARPAWSADGLGAGDGGPGTIAFGDNDKPIRMFVPSAKAVMKAAPVKESEMEIGSVLFKVAWKESDRGVYTYFQEGEKLKLLKEDYGVFLDLALASDGLGDGVAGHVAGSFADTVAGNLGGKPERARLRLNEIFGERKTSKGRDLENCFEAAMVVKGVSYTGWVENIRKSNTRGGVYRGDFTADVFTAHEMKKKMGGNDIIDGEFSIEFRGV